jgi:ribosomal protein L18E
MIKNFENETQPLTDYETNVLLPLLIRGLKTKIGQTNAVTNKYIVATLKGSYNLNEARVRKIINHIRTNDLIPGLVATSGGYFIAETEAELLEYEESLKGREDAIRAVRLAIARQRRILYQQAREKNLFND